jgi:hypothetical protein
MKKTFKKYLNIILLLFFTFGALGNLLSGDKIKIHLQQPPPNSIGVKDLWKLDIRNTSRENINIYLTGSVTESKKGAIVSGKSKVLTVSPGTKKYDYNDFKSGEVNWKDKSIQEIILRTGNVPEGEYTICVTAFYENNETADAENCIEQTVQQAGNITLVSPTDGAELDLKIPVIFTWTPLPKGSTYSLRITEIKGSQSPEAAIKDTRPVFNKDGIRTSDYQYGLADPKLEAGKKYAWQVGSGDSKSEVFTVIITNIVPDTLAKYLTGGIWENLWDPIICERQGVILQAAQTTSGPNLYRMVADFTSILYYENSGFFDSPYYNLHHSSISYEHIPFSEATDLYCNKDGVRISREPSGIYKITESHTGNGGIADLPDAPPVHNFHTFAVLWNTFNNEVQDDIEVGCDCGELPEGWESGWGSEWPGEIIEITILPFPHFYFPHRVVISPEVIHKGNNVKLKIVDGNQVNDLKNMGMVLSDENQPNLVKCECGKNIWANNKEQSEKICDYLKALYLKVKEKGNRTK